MNPHAHDTKTTLKSELKIIPTVGWAVAGIVLALWLLLVIPLIVHEEQKKAQPEMPLWGLQALLIFAGIVCSIWVLMIFYVNADAGRRRMNRLLWTLLVIFIPNAIGFIVYFLMRQPVARPCSKCGALLRPAYAYCPACGQTVAPTCPACHRTVEGSWAACAYCGVKLS